MLLVPFSSDYDQRFTVQLGGDKYGIDARWNERGQFWTFDLARDSDQVVLLAGAPLTVGQDLLAPYALGIGGILLTDLSKKNTDAGPDDFGTRVIAVYVTPEELATIKDILGPDGASIIASGAPPSLLPSRVPAGSPGSVTPGGTTINNVSITNIANSTTITGGGLAFSDKFEGLTDSSGAETLIGQYLQIPGLNPNPTVALEVAIYATGAGSLRAYYGGSAQTIGDTGTPSGTLATSAVAVSGAGIYRISATPANPGGAVLVKITMKSTAPATAIGVDIINGFLG